MSAVSIFGMPSCFFLVLAPFIVPIPRCLVGLSSTCKFCREYWHPIILSLISTRIFSNHLHIQTRIASVRALSRFVCVYDFYSVRTIKKVFRHCLSSVNSSFREAGISLLFKISEKFSYLVIISEFDRCTSKDEFVRLCKGKTIDRIGPRDPTCCRRVERLLSIEGSSKCLALIILRIYVEYWSESVFDTVWKVATASNNLLERAEAISGLKAYREYRIKNGL